jgi:branched-chain amino acid transport system ATP-binding protein
MSEVPRLLEVHGLAKRFGGVEAVRDVSFTVETGEIVALIGPNGAGKSTCFNMLDGQLSPDAGRIRILGQDTVGLSPGEIWMLGVGRTFQITATFGSMTVRENVQVALIQREEETWTFRRFAGAFHQTEAGALLDLVGLGEQAERPCGELAYGDLKRLELAVALANRPKLLLLDEPTAGMASRERVELMRLAARIAAERTLGVLFTEHDMDVVFEHARRVIVLDRGSVIAEGPPAAVRAHPEVRRVYLGESFDAASGSAPEVLA